MLIFALRKFVAGVILAIVVTAATFFMIYSQGEQIARVVLGGRATDLQVHRKYVELGLDEPAIPAYLRWLGHAFTGDLGNSYRTGESVTAVIIARLPVTLSVVLVALLFTALLAVLVGVAAAVYGGWLDRTLQIVGVAGAAIPNFVVAVGLVLLLAVYLPIFPATGYVPLEDGVGGWASSLVLPVAAILLGSVVNAAQQFRGAMIDAMQQDFVRTLRSRGISERAIVFRHALRNAATPGLTILSLQTIGLMGGVVVIERVFGLAGMGEWTATATVQNDLPAVLGSVLFTVIVVVVVNFVMSVVVGLVNPKARTS